MFINLSMHLTYASILGIIIPAILIFLLKNPKSVTFLRHSVILLLSLIFTLSLSFFIYLACVGSLAFT